MGQGKARRAAPARISASRALREGTRMTCRYIEHSSQGAAIGAGDFRGADPWRKHKKANDRITCSVLDDRHTQDEPRKGGELPHAAVIHVPSVYSLPLSASLSRAHRVRVHWCGRFGFVLSANSPRYTPRHPWTDSKMQQRGHSFFPRISTYLSV